MASNHRVWYCMVLDSILKNYETKYRYQQRSLCKVKGKEISNKNIKFGDLPPTICGLRRAIKYKKKLNANYSFRSPNLIILFSSFFMLFPHYTCFCLIYSLRLALLKYIIVHSTRAHDSGQSSDIFLVCSK